MLRFAERASRKLARQIFHGMARFGAKLQRRQAFLFRIVDVGLELFAMAATVSNARSKRGGTEGAQAERLADLFCRNSRRKVRRLFAEMWSNDDVRKYETAMTVFRGEQAWVEEGIVERPRNQ